MASGGDCWSWIIVSLQEHKDEREQQWADKEKSMIITLLFQNWLQSKGPPS